LCVSGEKGVEKYVEFNETQTTRVNQLVLGDVIKGVDENFETTACKVTAIGKYKPDLMYGGFTADHPVLSEEKDGMVKYGREGDETHEDSYDVLTDCPLTKDENGILFSGFGHCGKGKLSWSEYLTLYDAISTMVESSGSEIDWFDRETYVDMNHLAKEATYLCDLVLACDKADDEDDVSCRTLDDWADKFLEKEVKADKKDAGRRRRAKSGEILQHNRARKEKGNKKTKDKGTKTGDKEKNKK
jgi:hypothetical protein